MSLEKRCASAERCARCSETKRLIQHVFFELARLLKLIIELVVEDDVTCRARDHALACTWGMIETRQRGILSCQSVALS